MLQFAAKLGTSNVLTDYPVCLLSNSNAEASIVLLSYSNL
jgi:hypothetical protein